MREETHGDPVGLGQAGGLGDTGSSRLEVGVSEAGWSECETPCLGFHDQDPFGALSPQGDRGSPGAVGETGEKVSAAWGRSRGPGVPGVGPDSAPAILSIRASVDPPA